MRPVKTQCLAFLMLAVLPVVAIAQVPVVPPAGPVNGIAVPGGEQGSVEAAAVDRVFVESDVSQHHVKTLDEVKNAIKSATSLRPIQKRRLLRRIDRPHVAQRVTDEITTRAMASGLVVIEYDEQANDAVAMVDWDGLIEFIERLIPLIVQLIGLFG